MKIMISQPMNGKTQKQIEEEIEFDDSLSEDEIEDKINNIIYDNTDIEDVIISY